MNKLETVEILEMLTSAYPGRSNFISEKELNAAIGLWSELLASYQQSDVKEAIKTHIRRSAYFPTISEIIGLVVWSKNPSPEKAWDMIRTAIGSHGKDARNHVGETIQKAVDRIGLSTIELGREQDIRPLFMEVYRREVLK